MIEPTDISVSVEPDPLQPMVSLVRASLRYMHQIYVPNRYGEDSVRQAENRCQAEIWHKLYGGLERQVYFAEREVLMAAGSPSFDPRRCRKLGELLASVRNPFSGAVAVRDESQSRQDRTGAAILADRLDEQGCKDDAELVRRLAGLPCEPAGTCEITPVEPCPACEEMERGPVSYSVEVG